jgi:hypothetical protein
MGNYDDDDNNNNNNNNNSIKVLENSSNANYRQALVENYK